MQLGGIKLKVKLLDGAKRNLKKQILEWCQMGWRHGSFIAKNVVLMPSFVNIGAYVDEGSMIDTWASVGHVLKLEKTVIYPGAGIGGVLEPMQANPTIIEDNCFIGARSEIVEGVIVGEVQFSMGVLLDNLQNNK